jgi:hypothetical protein
MSCSNVEAKFKSQYLHIYRNAQFGWEAFSLGQGNGCAHVACSMKKGKSPEMTSCGPSNFEGDGLHLNLLKTNPSF